MARIELGSSFYDLYSDIDGYPSAAIVLKQTPGSNAATVIEKVKEKQEEIKESQFSTGHDLRSQLRRLSVLGCVRSRKYCHDLFEAFVLVALVVFPVPG